MSTVSLHQRLCFGKYMLLSIFSLSSHHEGGRECRDCWSLTIYAVQLAPSFFFSSASQNKNTDLYNKNMCQASLHLTVIVPCLILSPFSLLAEPLLIFIELLWSNVNWRTDKPCSSALWGGAVSGYWLCLLCCHLLFSHPVAYSCWMQRR